MLNPAWDLLSAQALSRQVGPGTRPPVCGAGIGAPAGGVRLPWTPFVTVLIPRHGALSAVFLSTTPALPEPLTGTCEQRPHPGTLSPNAQAAEDHSPQRRG